MNDGRAQVRVLKIQINEFCFSICRAEKVDSNGLLELMRSCWTSAWGPGTCRSGEEEYSVSSEVTESFTASKLIVRLVYRK